MTDILENSVIGEDKRPIVFVEHQPLFVFDRSEKGKIKRVDSSTDVYISP